MRPQASPSRFPLVVIPLAAFLAVMPLLRYGPSCGHDFGFHLFNWFEVARQFTHGVYPHWAYTPAYGAGEPRFVFYPPLSWALGALLGLLLPWNAVPAVFTWIALTLSGLTAYRLARQYAGPHAAVFAATLYLVNPYMLFTAYERTAFSELLAAAFIPLLFQAALEPTEAHDTFGGAAPAPIQPVLTRPRALASHILPVAIPIALVWLSNAPAAVTCCYALAFLTVLRLLGARGSRLPLALGTGAGTLLGLALAAFYIAPAAYERRFVQTDMVLVDGMRIVDNTLFHHMPATPEYRYHDQVLHTVSTVALILLAAVAITFLVVLFMSRRRNRSGKSPLAGRLSTPWVLALLSLLVLFFLTPWSLPLWAHVPELRFLQFPWRLLLLLTPALVILVALALGQRRIPLLASLLVAATFIAPGVHFFHQRCEPNSTVSAQFALFRSTLGTEGTDEYTPAGADADALHAEDPPYWLIPEGSTSSKARAAQGDQVAQSDQDAQEKRINQPAPLAAPAGPCPFHLALNLPAAEYLVLNCRQYPAWQPMLNHAPVEPSTPEREDGLLTVLLPAGPSTIDLVEHRMPDRLAGEALSSLAALCAIALWRRQRRGQA